MRILREEANRFCECHTKHKVNDWVSSYVRTYIDNKLSNIVQPNVIKAVADALTKQ